MKKISESDLRDILVNPHINRRTREICCDCAFCGKEQHMYVSIDTQLWDCKRCGEHGSIIKLLRHLDKLYLLGGSTIDDNDEIKSLRDTSMEVEQAYEEDLKDIRMPAGWRVLSNSCEYLLGRGIDGEICKRYNIGDTKLVERYKNYILIPIYDESKIRGFIGRYANKVVPEDKLRYSNSLHTQFARLLFGYDEIVTGKTKTVILVEGVFDKIACDRYLSLWDSDDVKCVCTFGKKISESQIRKLEQKKISSVILLYDFDAVKEMKRYSVELEKHFETYITFTVKKDIDECTKQEALKVFSRLYRPSEFRYSVIGKLK